MENGKQPAYPLVYDGHAGPSFCNDGLTKREYFAAMAMSGLAAVQEKGDFPSFEKASEVMAEFAVKAADALLKELDK